MLLEENELLKVIVNNKSDLPNKSKPINNNKKNNDKINKKIKAGESNNGTTLKVNTKEGRCANPHINYTPQVDIYFIPLIIHLLTPKKQIEPTGHLSLPIL